jgi:hypothetical protein
MHILRDFAGMVPAAFEISGDHDIIGAVGDISRVFHHVGNSFVED